MRAAAIAAAVITAFIGVMYLRFSGDAVPPPEPASSPEFGSSRVVARSAPPDVALAEACRRYARFPKPEECNFDAGWFFPTIPATPPPVVVRLDSLDGVEVMPLDMGAEIEFPSDLALIIQPSCGNCVGPAGGLSRVYRDSSGQIRTDTLVTIESLGLPPYSQANPNGAHFTGFVADEDGAPIAVSVCKSSNCFKEPPTAAAEAAIFQSDDGGISWSEVQGLEGVGFVSSVLPDGRLLVGGYGAVPGVSRYRILPGGEELTPPAETPFPAPLALANGEIVWTSPDDGIVRGDGSRWLGEWADPQRLNVAWRFAFNPSRERAVASAFVPGSGSGANVLVIFRTDGTLDQAYSTPGYVTVYAWLDDHRVLATAETCAGLSPARQYYSHCQGASLAIIDLETRVIHPFQPGSNEPVVPFLVAVQRGPFARVVNTGSCLNVRKDPSADAHSFGCMADGVLLRDFSDTHGDPDVGPRYVTTVNDGITWVGVIMHSGTVGWANAQYLER